MNGLMSHTIQVYRPVNTQDAIGGIVTSYTLLMTVKGRIPGGSSSSADMRGTIGEVQSITCMLPVVTTIQISDVLVKDGLYYEIQTIANRGDHHLEVEVVRTNPDISRT